MMKYLVTFSICMLASFLLEAQEIDNSLILGDWENQQGEPGVVLEEDDGSEVHVSPLIYSTTVLTLKKNARVIERNFFEDLEIVRKGTWTVHGDTLSIEFEDHIENFEIDQSVEGRVFLKLLPNGLYYSRR